MRIVVQATQNIERLKQNLEKRVESVEQKDGKLVVEDSSTETVEKTPGVETYTVNGEEHEGLKGKPVETEAYARIESEKDAVKALLATIQGYDLRILETGRLWDIRQLRKYNPDIKQLRSEEPEEVFQIDKTISDLEGIEKVEIEMPDDRKKIKKIYREMLT